MGNLNDFFIILLNFFFIDIYIFVFSFPFFLGKKTTHPSKGIVMYAPVGTRESEPGSPGTSSNGREPRKGDLK